MSILAELSDLAKRLDIPVETITFTDKPPDEYIVLTPLVDALDEYADNMPQQEVSEVRISLFTKRNYLSLRDQLTRLLLGADFTITDRRFIEFESDTGYFHYNIDVEKAYFFSQ